MVNFQLAVRFVSESHVKAQLNWNFCPCLEHVSKTAFLINPLKPNDLYISRATPLISKFCILYIYSKNVGTEYFKHALYSAFFSVQNTVCFIMLTSLVPVLFTFYIQGVLK